MAFDGKYAPPFRRATPKISVSGIGNAEQALTLIRHFEGTGCNTHVLEVSALASQVTLVELESSRMALKPSELGRIGNLISKTNSSHVLFSVHYGLEPTDGLSASQLDELRAVSETSPREQLNSIMEKSHLSMYFDRTAARYGVQANLGWDADVIANFSKMRARFQRIITAMEVRSLDGASLLRRSESIDHLVINLPREEGKGFDAAASVAAAKHFLGQNEYLTIGFVGGLTPDTAGGVIREVAPLAKTSMFSVGFESGVRTEEGLFDMDKAKAAIEAATSEFSKQRTLLRE